MIQPANSTLDSLDLRILEALQNDASRTNHDLAQVVHASAATCLRRVRRLVDEGFIERQVAIISARHVALGLTAIVEITLDHQGADQQSAFEALLKDESAITQCYRVSGGPDFVLIVHLVDMAAYHVLAHRLFASQGNVRNVRTYFSTHRSKFETRIPLPVP